MKNQLASLIPSDGETAIRTFKLSNHVVSIHSIKFHKQGIECDYDVCKTFAAGNITSLKEHHQSKIDSKLRKILEPFIKLNFEKKEFEKAIGFPSSSSSPGTVSPTFTYHWGWN